MFTGALEALRRNLHKTEKMAKIQKSRNNPGVAASRRPDARPQKVQEAHCFLGSGCLDRMKTPWFRVLMTFFDPNLKICFQACFDAY